MAMFNDLDPLLHSQLRLAIVSLLVSEEKTTFSQIKEVTKATSGNISVQIQKLEQAGYITVRKSFKDNYPNTELQLTPKGLQAFEEYVMALKGYLNLQRNEKTLRLLLTIKRLIARDYPIWINLSFFVLAIVSELL